jgi:hypothetical protein
LDSTQNPATRSELFCVHRHEVPHAWPEIERCICRVKDVPWSLSDVRGFLEDGKALAWGLRDERGVLGFWITRIEGGYAAKYGLVWICAGAGIELGLPKYFEIIEPWFWAQGCEWIEINGRKGWKRVMPGYDEVAVTLRKYRDVQRHVE